MLDNSTLKHKEFVKFSEVLIDDKLSWENHIGKLCSKICNGYWALSRSRNFENHQMLLKICYPMIYFHLNHNISLWGYACPSNLVPLFKLQKESH